MPLFYHRERLQPPHKVCMSPFFMLSALLLEHYILSFHSSTKAGQGHPGGTSISRSFCYSSEKESVLLNACFLWLREGNDNPNRMDYQGCEHPFTILYTLRLLKSIRCYFSDDVACTVNVGID